MQLLEEKARASLAEAQYNHLMEQKLHSTHELDEENLDLGAISNSQRGFQLEKNGLKKKKEAKNKGSKLSRELKKISYQ